MKKKIFSIVSIFMCVVISALCLTSCSGPGNDMTEENIKATVAEAVDALKEFDTERLGKYVDSSTLSVIVGYAKDHKQFTDLGKAIFASLEYEVKEIDLENGTVTVSFKNKDLYQAAADFASQLKKDYSSFQLLTKLNEEDFLDLKLAQLTKAIEDAPMLESATDVKLSITQGKKNLVLTFDKDAENAVSGGSLNAINSIYKK